MNTLLEIARIVTSRTSGRKSVESVVTDETDGVLSTFLRGLLEQNFENDDDAAQSLYGTDRNDQRYRTLKSRAFDRLLQALLLLEVRKPTHSEYMMYYHRCGRNLVAARTLMSFASRRAGTRIAEKTLVIAKKYQFTEFTLNLLTLLRESYAMFVDKRRFTECTEQINYYMNVLEAELSSEELLDLLQMETRQRKMPHEKLMEYAEELFNNHEALHSQIDSHKIRLNHYRFSVIFNALRSNLDAVNIACDDARSYLAGTPHLSQRARVGEFGLLKMQACVHNQQGHLILPEIDTIQESFLIGGMNWYITLEFGILACLQCGNYQRAAELWKRGQSSNAIRSISPKIQEMWYLFEAYLHVLYKLGRLSEPIEKARIDDLSLFTASAPEFSKENTVFNIHVLIVQVVLLISDGQHEAANRRIDHLRVYVSQFLKPPKESAVRRFVTRVVALSKVGFNIGKLRTGNNESKARNEVAATVPAHEEFNEIVPLNALFEHLLSPIRKEDV